jgi:hypothetical protein
MSGAKAQSKVLLPGQSYMGARLMQRINEAGFPDPQQGISGQMMMFVFPVAIAVSPMRDIYIADSGTPALFRYDASLDAMSVIRGVRVTQQTRLAALNDGSVIVANGGSVPAIRISRSGKPLQAIDGQLGSAFYDEVAVDSVSGKYYGLDRVQKRLEEIMPHGRGATILPERLLPEQPVAMAMDGQKLYVAGRSCQCVVAIDLFGTRDATILVEDAGLISAMAAGGEWLVVADSRDKIMRIYRQGALVGEPDYQTLKLMDPRGMAISYQTLYIADALARRIVTFRMRS